MRNKRNRKEEKSFEIKFYFHKIFFFFQPFFSPVFAVVAFPTNILFKFEADQKNLLLATRFNILEIIFAEEFFILWP
jgi:hypothetical protein